MEHAGEYGVHLSVGAEMDTHSDQAAHTKLFTGLLSFGDSGDPNKPFL